LRKQTRLLVLLSSCNGTRPQNIRVIIQATGSQPMTAAQLNSTGHLFGDTPDVAMLWQSPGLQQIYVSLLENIATGVALQLVYGEPGLGKTLLARRLYNSLQAHDQRYRVRFMPYPGIDLDDFMPAPDPENENRRDVVIIDEAQAVPNQTLLAIARHLHRRDNSSETQFVLFAQPELADRLQAPSLKLCSEITQQHHQLRALTKAETADYIHARISKAALTPSLTPDDVLIDNIFAYSNGVPRLINTLMRKAMLQARLENCNELTKDHLSLARQTLEFRQL
jgi:MSHA biogenesis protein MshM